MDTKNHASEPDRTAIVTEARSWIGTPYHHQASIHGIGTDCLGLVRGVYRALYGREAELPPPYTADWAEATGHETLLEAGNRHLVRIAIDQARPGDVLVFRYRHGLPAKHTGILVTATTMVHASEGAPVCEVVLAPWWRRRIAGAFRFPGIHA